MKIAFLIGEFPSLSETFVLNQLTGLIERGHKVDIYASIPKITTKIHPDVEKFNLLNHTYYYPKLPKNYLLRLLKGFKLLVFNWTKNPKALLRSLNIFKYGRRAVSLRLLYAAIPFVGKQSQYDIVQCHFGIEGFKGIELKEINAIDGNLCTTFHGLDINGLIQKHGARVFNDLMRRGDLFLPISEDCKQQLIEKGCDENKILVHRMGIDCQKFTFTPRKLRPNDKIRLVTIARLVEKKGVEYGVRAIAQLSLRYPNLEYSIVGDGERRDSLERLIKELDAEQSVKMLGWKQSSEIIEILNKADILLAPSVTSKDGDREGIPVALMEAMAMGLPVISTFHSGIPELVEDGVSGLLVPERDSDALAKKINYLIEHPEVWPQIGQHGRLKVEEFFNINKLNNQLVEIYQELKHASSVRPLNTSKVLAS